MELPMYIPLSEAAEKYRIGRQALTRLVTDGRIRAANVGGGVVVSEEDVKVTASREQLWEKVAHLDGHPIGVKEAARKYGLGTAHTGP